MTTPDREAASPARPASETLLPCPFCGDLAHPRAENGLVWIECGTCHSRSSAKYKSFAEATAAWNRRALSARDAEVAELRNTVDWLRSCNTTHMDQMRVKDASIAALKSQLAAASARLAECEGDLNIARLQRDAKLCPECPRSPALEADARRYRFVVSLMRPTEFTGSHYRYEFLLPSERTQTFDAAIDAALSPTSCGVGSEREGRDDSALVQAYIDSGAQLPAGTYVIGKALELKATPPNAEGVSELLQRLRRIDAEMLDELRETHLAIALRDAIATLAARPQISEGQREALNFAIGVTAGFVNGPHLMEPGSHERELAYIATLSAMARGNSNE